MSSKLQVFSRPLIFKRRGRVVRSHVIGAQPKTFQESRLIDAEVLHGDEQAFWCERRWKNRNIFMPTWDRVAQTVILMTRHAPRVPQEAAFRIFAVFLKVLLITKVTDLTASMLPLWTTMNVQGLISQAKKEVAEAEKTSGETTSPAKAADPIAASKQQDP